jgi:hypothetical protein
VADFKRAKLRGKWSTIPKAAVAPTKTAAFQQSAVALHRVAAFCFTRRPLAIL